MKKIWMTGLLCCGLASAAQAEVVLQLGSFRDVGLAQQQMISTTLMEVEVRLEPVQ